MNAEYVSGIDFVLKLAGIDALLNSEKIDFILTGEGRIDAQTLHGKLINGIVKLGMEHHIPVIAICGQLDTEVNVLKDQGLSDIIEVRDKSQPLSYNMDHAAELVERAVAKYFKRI